MHLPELELTAYLGVFLPPDVVEEVLDHVALTGLEAETEDVLDLYVYAHEELHRRARVDPEVERDVLGDEGGLTLDEVSRVLAAAAAPEPGAVQPEDAGADGAQPPEELRVAVDLGPRETEVQVRVLGVAVAQAGAPQGEVEVQDDPEVEAEGAPAAAVPPPGGPQPADEAAPAGESAPADQVLPPDDHPITELARIDDDAGPHVYPRVQHRPAKPLIPRWLIVVVAVLLVLWLGIALLSDAARERFALLGLNPWLLLIGVGGPMLAGYAFLRAGDALEDRTTVGDEAIAAAPDDDTELLRIIEPDATSPGAEEISDPASSDAP